MNPIFPASYSTLSSAFLAVLVSEIYGLADVKCRLLVRGVGDTYLVQSLSGRFILRIYRASHRSLPQIKAEMELLTALKNAGVRVSYPVADKLGKLFQSLPAAEGIRHAALFTYAPGNVVGILNDIQLRSLGHQMAGFHKVSSTLQLGGDRWKINLETTLFEPLELIRSFFDHDAAGFNWLMDSANETRAYFSSIDVSALSSGYCHFDFLSKNFHFDENDEPTFFDFDFFGHGWLVNDIMTFYQQLCLDVYFGRMTKESADRSYTVFIAAYREKRDLTKEELSAVRHLSLGFWVFYMGFYTTHDQFFPLLQPAHLALRLNLMKQVMRYE